MVADHRANDDHARRAAPRLGEAQQREAVDAVGEHAARRGEREEAESDEEKKSRLKRAAEAVSSVGKDVLTGVLTHIITQGT